MSRHIIKVVYALTRFDGNNFMIPFGTKCPIKKKMSLGKVTALSDIFPALLRAIENDLISIRSSERNSVVVGSNPTQANFL